MQAKVKSLHSLRSSWIHACLLSSRNDSWFLTPCNQSGCHQIIYTTSIYTWSYVIWPCRSRESVTLSAFATVLTVPFSEDASLVQARKSYLEHLLACLSLQTSYEDKPTALSACRRAVHGGGDVCVRVTQTLSRPKNNIVNNKTKLLLLYLAWYLDIWIIL